MIAIFPIPLIGLIALSVPLPTKHRRSVRIAILNFLDKVRQGFVERAQPDVWVVGSSFISSIQDGVYLTTFEPTCAQQLSFYKFEFMGASFTLLALIIIVALFGLGGWVNAMHAHTHTIGFQ